MIQEFKINYFAIPGMDRKYNLTCQKIIDRVCEYFNVRKMQLLGKSRTRHTVTPRHIAMYLIRAKTNENLLNIGKMFNKDHTTVLKSVSKINGFIFIEDEETVRAIKAISNSLR